MRISDWSSDVCSSDLETVDQTLIELGLFGLRAPDDPLMKIGNADAVILVVIGEEELILRLGQVINGAWIDRIEDFLFATIFAGIDLDREIPFGDFHAGSAVTVYANRYPVDARH